MAMSDYDNDPFFDPYQEAMDHEMGSASEAQNVLAMSRMNTHIPNDTEKAIELSAQGKFVVMRGYQVFCQHTDATLGYGKVILSVHDTLEAATAAAPPQAGFDEGDYDEDSPYVFTPPRILVSRAAEVDEDEIPF